MIMNKMFYPLTLALVAALATTGCKHGFTKVTPLPEGPSVVGPGTGPGLIPGGQMPTDTGPSTVQTGGGPTSEGDINGMIPARAALAEQTVYFAFDSYVVKTKEHGKLVVVAEALKSDPNAKLLVEGNCDERGTEEYNRSLGEHRSLAAREGLAKLGIDPMRVFTRSYGKDKPADPGHDESAWSKNRRDDFVLLHPKP